MLFINRLRLEISTTNPIDTNTLYGFDIPFRKGLNIIAGENSTGKSTINSCIYYALGMEELLGGQNDKALDKSLKTAFETFTPDGEEVQHRISIAKVFIELENLNGAVVTIRRNIHNSNNQVDGKKAYIYESSIDKVINRSNDIKSFPLFIRNENNHTDEYGFYHWLSNYIGLNLPTVASVSKKSGESLLYLQTIFPAFFIEQTKGWSDFLATIPYMGIPRNKEKSIAFVLNLDELSISSQLEQIDREEKELKQSWNNLLSRLDLLSKENNASLHNIPKEITKDKDAIKSIDLLFVTDEGKQMPISEFLKTLTEKSTDLSLLPIKKIGEVKDEVRLKLENLHKDQETFKIKFAEFDQQLNLEKEQFETISEQLIKIRTEISIQTGIHNVFNEAIIKEDLYNKCPTCHQEVNTDLVSTDEVKISSLTLDENIEYLKGQEKMMKIALSSLQKILDEKSIIRKYYIKNQRNREEEIKVIFKELISDDRDYSPSNTLQRVRLENKVNEIQFVETEFKAYLSELEALIDNFKIVTDKKDGLGTERQNDNLKLARFQSTFKRYLNIFEYQSNTMSHIYIQSSDPFKYFPVFKLNANDIQPQAIKTNSSASDFVRTLWAYNIALLLEGRNHPGLIIFDEPGQHSVKSSSLKNLFETSAKIKDKQIILFSSAEYSLLDNNSKKSDFDIFKLLTGLKQGIDYSMYMINRTEKSIAPLN